MLGRFGDDKMFQRHRAVCSLIRVVVNTGLRRGERTDSDPDLDPDSDSDPPSCDKHHLDKIIKFFGDE